MKDPKFHVRTKHIDVWYHFIRALVRTGKVEITYVPMDDNLADVLTKALPRVKFESARTSIGVLPARGGVLDVQAEHKLNFRLSQPHAWHDTAQYGLPTEQ